MLPDIAKSLLVGIVVSGIMLFVAVVLHLLWKALRKYPLKETLRGICLALSVVVFIYCIGELIRWTGFVA